jgi:hypothetical protein
MKCLFLYEYRFAFQWPYQDMNKSYIQYAYPHFFFVPTTQFSVIKFVFLTYIYFKTYYRYLIDLPFG